MFHFKEKVSIYNTPNLANAICVMQMQPIFDQLDLILFNNAFF